MTCSSAWDSTPIGRFFHLHLCQNENLSPQLIIEDKVIRSIVHLKNTSTIYFIATLISDDESQRLTYVIDRFLITNDIHNQQLLTGEFPVPIQCDMKSSTMLDTFIQSAIQDMDSYCHSSSSPIELHRFSYLCGQMLAKYSSSSSSPVNIHFSFNLLTLNNSFKLTPINAPCMQILPTALLKSLSSSTGNSIYKNQAHFGYCSLDRMLRNKILLILENDPQACTLPLIGIWVSGITDIQCSFVWAACLRFCMNSSLKQRLRSENEPFLLACYLSTSHGQCEFYEAKPMTMDSNTIEYDRWACSKQINMPNLPAHELDTSCSTQFPYDFEFRRICDNSNFRASPMKNASAIPLDHYQAILTSPNTNGSLFGFPRLPPRQSAHEQPSWEVITTAPMLTPKRQSRPSSSSSSVKSKEFLSPTSPIDVSDNRWKEELIERMQSYETHFLSLTKLVHQLLNAQNQQNLLTTTPKKECSKRDVAVQSEPSSPYFDESFDKTKHHIIRSPNTGHYQQPVHQLTSNQFQSPSSQTTTDQSTVSPDLKSIDILKPIFQYIDNQQQRQQKTVHNSTDTLSPKSNEEEVLITSDSSNPISKHVTSTRMTGISFTANGVQMQFINQQSSTSTVYPPAQLLLTSPQKSENNLSIEVHALEMKYLEDDQLAAAIECDRSSATTSTTVPPSSQITNKSLSFETQEYLQRYGLFSDENK